MLQGVKQLNHTYICCDLIISINDNPATDELLCTMNQYRFI